MEDKYLKEIWSSPDHEIDGFLDINNQSFVLHIKKVKSRLKSLFLPKIIGIVLGLGWILFMFMLIYFSLLYTPMSLGKVFFISSVTMILLITGLGVFLYVKDIFTLKQIDMSENVMFTQRKLASLQLSIMNSVRVLWLQLPFYTTWYLNYELITHGSVLFRIIQILLTGLTTWLAIWLFTNTNYKGLHKKWVQNFMRGYGFYRISEAMDFINEIDNLKNDKYNAQ